MQPNDVRAGQGWDSPGRLIPALILIGIGVLFLLNNLNILPGVDWWNFWPVILIIVGLYKLVDGGERSYVGGAILFGAGAVLLANNLGYLPVSVWQLWPLLLIALGIGLLLERMPWHDHLGGIRSSSSRSSSAVNLTAVFSGGKRNFDGEDFRGGVVSTVFGGYELDMRRARMTAPSAVLQVDAVFGGCEIKVPETWNVVVHGGAVFGGFSDETRHPPASDPETRQLVVKGGAVFGGVVVKN